MSLHYLGNQEPRKWVFLVMLKNDTGLVCYVTEPHSVEEMLSQCPAVSERAPTNRVSRVVDLMSRRSAMSVIAVA